MTMTIDTPSTDRRAFIRGTVMIAGAAVTLPSIVGLAGCSAPPSIAEHMALISAVSNRIVPATDTPGAIAAKVPDYIAAVFDQHFTQDQQEAFLAGLKVLDAEGFADEASQRQDEILAEFASSPDGETESAIFQQLHDMTVFGFYTSEVATQELSYEEIPGRYDACVPLSEVGRAWLERGV